MSLIVSAFAPVSEVTRHLTPQLRDCDEPSYLLLFDRSIRPGDVINIGDSYGWVQKLAARYIVVRDRNGVDTLIPTRSSSPRRSSTGATATAMSGSSFRCRLATKTIRNWACG